MGSGAMFTAVQFQCRAVNLAKEAADANTKLAFAVQEALMAKTNLFETTNITASAVSIDPSELTITFEMTLRLKRPMKL